MALHIQLAADSSWLALRERFASVESGPDLTLTDGDSANGPRLLLHREPDPDAPDEAGFFLESGVSTLVEIGPGESTSRELLAAGWTLAGEAGLVPIRLAPGERSLVTRLREIEDPGLPEENEAARLAIFLGTVLEDAATGARELDLILRHARPGRPHPFDLLNARPNVERTALLDRAREEAGLASLPWPLRRDLRSGTALAERRVELRFENGLARIRLIRPHTLNALDPEMLDELSELWHQAETRSTTEAIVLEAEGPAFMAGVDLGRVLAWIESDRLDRIEEFVERAHRLLHAIDASPHHTVACLDGLAVGAGAEFCAAFDTVLASERASVGFPELSLAIYPAMGGTQRLPRRIGYHRARAWILSATLLTAHRAKETGLVDAIVSGYIGDVREHALQPPVSGRAASHRTAPDGPPAGIPQNLRWRGSAPVALKIVEELLELSRRTPLGEGLTAEIANLPRVFATTEALRGIRRAQGRARRSRSV